MVARVSPGQRQLFTPALSALRNVPRLSLRVLLAHVTERTTLSEAYHDVVRGDSGMRREGSGHEAALSVLCCLSASSSSSSSWAAIAAVPRGSRG